MFDVFGQDDTAYAKFMTYMNQMSFVPAAKEFTGETVTNAISVQYESARWKIENYAKLDTDSDFTLESPDFVLCGRPFHATCNPNINGTTRIFVHETASPDEDTKTPSEQFCRFTMSILTSDNEPSATGFGRLNGLKQMKSAVKFEMDRKKVLTANEFLSPNGDIVLEFQLVALVAKNKKKLKTKNDQVHPATEIIESMRTMFINGEHSDLKIILDDKTEFKVHSLILKQRCEYFKKMLSAKMKESKEGNVNIDGVRRHTMEACLLYMYTGEFPVSESTRTKWLVPNEHGVSERKKGKKAPKKSKEADESIFPTVLHWLVDVQIAADRFQLEGLLLYINSRIATHISCSNVAEWLLVSHETHNAHLFNICAEMLKEAPDRIVAAMKSKEWGRVHSNHVLFNNVMSEVFAPKVKKATRKRKKPEIGSGSGSGSDVGGLEA